MIKIELSPEQCVTLMRLLGAGQGAMEYSLEHDDVGSAKGLVHRMCVSMIADYKEMIKLIADQHNAQV